MATSSAGAEEQVPERAAAVLEYWFGSDCRSAPDGFYPKEKTSMWFRGGAPVDEYIRTHFKQDLELAAQGAYDSWRDLGPLSLVAGVVLMDQFSRNMYRGTPKAFELDPKSLAWAMHALDNGAYASLPSIMKVALVLPMMHAEDEKPQQLCVDLMTKEAAATAEAYPELSKSLDGVRSYGQMHLGVIKEWGRFPHRNAILGRASTPEEAAGLAAGSIAKF